MIAAEAAPLDSLGFAAIETTLRAVLTDADAVAQIRRRADDAVAKINGDLKDSVIDAKAREIRKTAETEAATYLRDQGTHAKLAELADEEPFWSPELILSRARFTVPRGTLDDVTRENTAAVAAALTLERADADELRLTARDAIRRKWWAVAHAALREARHRARQASRLTDASPEHVLVEELGGMITKAFPVPARARELFGRARAAAIQISEELRLTAQVPPRARRG